MELFQFQIMANIPIIDTIIVIGMWDHIGVITGDRIGEIIQDKAQYGGTYIDKVNVVRVEDVLLD